ncbi:MBL fold metallo-hydrolase [Synergistales bacterium]|nr:MBL fold metallo-hydrolase [Synergistales bacterium]
MKDYRIYPLKLAEFQKAEKSSFSYLQEPGTKIKAPVIAYLIRGEKTDILVDTGCSDPEWAAKHHHPLIQTEDMLLSNALKRFDLKPGDIRVIINTHLHWDHCFNNDLFPNAKIYVQKRELQFAINPLPTQYVYYEAPQIGLIPPFLKSLNQYAVVDGDCVLQDGIELVLTPGHTPGFQCVSVNTEKGRYLIASDCIGLLENWEKGTHGMPTPSGIHVSLEEYYASFEKMKKICDFVLPGHDSRVFEHKVYPC